jgi:hypothetical protein
MAPRLPKYALRHGVRRPRRRGSAGSTPGRHPCFTGDSPNPARLSAPRPGRRNPPGLLEESARQHPGRCLSCSLQSIFQTGTNTCTLAVMYLAGVPVADPLVLELAGLLHDEELEMKLRSALARDVRVLALETDERETILVALADAPIGLEELRATLLQDHTWWQREGL